MAAAENGALPGGKVGGVGDVVRDLPRALTGLGWRTTVVTPEYGLFGRLPGAEVIDALAVNFGGRTIDVDVVTLPGDHAGVEHVALRHPLFAPHGPRIYCDDGPARPFASDATKFALFSAALAAYVSAGDDAPDIVHLHDWHAAFYTVLRRFDPAVERLQKIRTVYTIHNLALQGVRPLDGDESSLTAWYPELDCDSDSIVDPRYPNCVNPMAAAIRLADGLNTVSPTYAQEILRPNDPERGFRGGEGLEADLDRAAKERSLSGILNGCDYPPRNRRRPGWRRLIDTIGREVYEWIVEHRGNRHFHEAALEHLRALPSRRPRNLLTSIGRLTEQKAQLFLERTGDGSRAIEKILGSHARDTVIILLGSGDSEYERVFADIANHHRNFLFLCGYSETFSDLLYRSGDLFLMPSSFEPCGISQMLAMRASQPCLVHAVGGLRDTVIHGDNGFSFDGASPATQAENFVSALSRAIATKNDDQDQWLRIRSRAEAARFSWPAAAERYVRLLYTAQPNRPGPSRKRT